MQTGGINSSINTSKARMWLILRLRTIYMYHIAGTFPNSWANIFKHWTTNIYPRMKQPCLPLPACKQPTMKILSTKWLNIIQPQMFPPPPKKNYPLMVYAHVFVPHTPHSLYNITWFPINQGMVREQAISRVENNPTYTEHVHLMLIVVTNLNTHGIINTHKHGTSKITCTRSKVGLSRTLI